ncbi:MAG TPA: ribonuclease J [Chloroflexota bacterium]|nr:ribonuclease J [Chloroflexota bacterium]
MVDRRIKVIPLGGVGSVGKNITAIEYDDSIVVIDCGLMFPEDEMLGVDLVLPDIRYLRERKDKVAAILLTHGHEDHIGALPYLLPLLNVPLYGTPLTMGFVRAKLREHGLHTKVEMNVVGPDTVTRLGPFTIEYVPVTHSIPDGVAIAVHTPIGTILHSGDYKFDPTPVDGRTTDVGKLAELGRNGVLALLSDCVRVESQGWTPSERVVGEAFDRVFAQAQGRVIITTFASNISRVQQAITTAYRHGRVAAIVGRSMENNTGVAAELGYFHVPEGSVRSVDEVNNLPFHRVLFMTTGSQGEPNSVLSRIANGDHRQIQLEPGDTVIFSATPVPGNEEAVSRTINKLFKQGATVIYGRQETVHVSGHASTDELKLMISLTRPRYVVPLHGDYRHMALYARVAQEAGIPRENILIPDLGTVIEFDDAGRGRIAGSVPAGAVFVDGISVGEVDHVILRDRQLLARDGIFVVVAAVELDTGRVVAGPDIITRGFVDVREASELLEGARERVRRLCERSARGLTDWSYLHQKIKDALGPYLYELTGRRPMILPLVMEV